MSVEQDQILNDLKKSDYKYGFTTNIDSDTIPAGLTEETVRLISSKKEEPEFMLELRLKAFKHWKTMKMPTGRIYKYRKSITRKLFFTRRQNKKPN